MSSKLGPGSQCCILTQHKKASMLHPLISMHSMSGLLAVDRKVVATGINGTHGCTLRLLSSLRGAHGSWPFLGICAELIQNVVDWQTSRRGWVNRYLAS